MCLGTTLKAAAVEGESFGDADAALKLAEATKYFTRDTVTARHDLVIIEDKVYDAAAFQYAHPGGAVFVAMFGGRDGTLAFQSYHSRAFPHEKMAPYLRGNLAPTETPTEMDPAHHALSKELRTQLAARGGSFAPRFQIYKAAFIWAAAVALEAYALCVQRTWVGAAVLGFLFAQIGLNIQHDANHGAMFKNGLWNVAWGLSQNWIGGSQVMWLQEHVVLHHMHTGDVEMDPDAQMAPAMRGHSRSTWLPWMAFQQYYFLLLELGYGVVPNVVAFFEVLAWSHRFEYPLSKLARPFYASQSTLLHLAYYLRLVALPAAAALRRAAPGDEFGAVGVCLAQQALLVCVGGFYLAFFFFLSHNFDGVNFVEGAEASGAAQHGGPRRILGAEDAAVCRGGAAAPEAVRGDASSGGGVVAAAEPREAGSPRRRRETKPDARVLRARATPSMPTRVVVIAGTATTRGS